MPAPCRPDPAHGELEPLLALVEQRLDDLQSALSARDNSRIERLANELQQALASAVAGFTQAVHQGAVPRKLRRRLALAGAQVAAQRDAMARATAALDRAIDVLMPGFGAGSSLYTASGTPGQRNSGGSTQA
jgi:uncharacterized membrane protein YccC